MITKTTEQPIDCILEYLGDILICSYEISSGKRTGKIKLLDKETLVSKQEYVTTGTLHGAVVAESLYLANSTDVSLYKSMELIKNESTSSMNTYVFIGDYVYISNLNGEISFYDFELNLIKKISITNEPIWVVKQHGIFLYFGDESGKFYVYNLENDTFIDLLSIKYGIIEIFFNAENYYIFSYDSNIRTYNIEASKLVSIIQNVPSIWKIIKYKDIYVCACIYDGIIVFDMNFKKIFEYKTNSICYALCIYNENLYFSSFYDKILHSVNINEFIKSNKIHRQSQHL